MRRASLPGLRERQDLHQLVQRAEAAGKHDERARQVREPELAHEEVVELERELARDIGIRLLLVRQHDVESDRPAAGIRGAAIGRLHDAAAATGADDVTMRVRRETLRPRGDEARQLARVVVIAAERSVGARAAQSRRRRSCPGHARGESAASARDTRRGCAAGAHRRCRGTPCSRRRPARVPECSVMGTLARVRNR